MIRVAAESHIQADIQTVWDAMVKIAQYPDWNPFIVKIESDMDPPLIGAEMKFTVCWQDGSTQKTLEVVDGFDAPHEEAGTMKAEWSYFFKSFLSTIGMVRATRKQILRSTEGGATHYETYEEFSGWGIRFLPIANIKDGFERQTAALKAYCEGKLS